MTTATPLNHFDRSKPFYPLVMDFIAGAYGWLVLLSRGIGRRAAEAAAREGSEISENVQGVPLRALATAAGLPNVIKPLELASRVQGAPIGVDPELVPIEGVEQFDYLKTQIPRAAEHLLLLARETTHAFREGDSKHDPLWEFLRHCRNAAGHGGRFSLQNGEPRRPAVWGPLEITPELQGTRLFDGPARDDPSELEQGLLAPGDAIALLWDIEQAFPELTADEGA